MSVNILSLFDGISCGRLALERAGIKVEKYYASEITKSKIKASQNYFPNNIQIGDIQKVSGYDYDVDILLGGSPCFVKDTQILTQKGYCNIQQIEIGQKVLTHSNRWCLVTHTGNTQKETIVIKAQGIYPTETTLNHPYYIKQMTRKWDTTIYKSVRTFSQPIWKNAGDLKRDDFLSIPIIKDEKNIYNLTDDECYVIGRYIADGHTRKDYRKEKGREHSRYWALILSVGSHKIPYSGLSYSLYPHTKSTHRMVFCNKRLVQIVEKECGNGAIHKKISPSLLFLPVDKLKVLLKGLMDGDGSKRGDEIRLGSISKELIQSTCLAIAKVFKVAASVEFYKRPKTTIIEGRLVNQHNSYSLSYREKIKKQSDFYVDDNHIWVRFKDSKLSKVIKTVYNLTVDGDNTYIANNAVVHNCQGFSIMGNRLNFADPRSGLIMDYFRILKELGEKNPNVYFLLENVPMDKQCEIEISRRLGVLPVKINSLRVSGQSRLRIYWTNIPGTGANLFGDEIKQPEDKGISLKDILQPEDEVDEKYYLKKNVRGYVDKRLLNGKQTLNGNKTRALTESYARNTGTMVSNELFNVNPSGNGESGRVYHTANKSRCLLANGGGGGAKTGLYLISDQFINKNQNGAGFKENPEKSYTLNTVDRQALVIDLDKYRVRKLTPTECCRLQTVPDDYFDSSGLSDNQIYSCLGDGWTVDVVAHILKGLTTESINNTL